MQGFRPTIVASLVASGLWLLAPGAHLVAQSPGISLAPSDPRASQEANRHQRQGWHYLSVEAWESAREEFLKAIRIIRVFPNAYYGLGKAHMGLRAYEKAAQAFSTCRDQYTMLVGSEFTHQLATKQRRQDQIQELRSIIRELQNSRANQTRAAQGMPQSRQVRELEEYLRQIEDADRSGRSVAPEMSVPAEVYLSLGSALFRSSKLAEAEAEYRHAIKAKPDFGEAYNNLAVVCLETGRIDEAEKFVKAAEKNGFRVQPQLKEEIKNRRKSGPS